MRARLRIVDYMSTRGVSIALAVACVAIPFIAAAQQMGRIYRGGVEETHAQIVSESQADQQFLYVVAGDVRNPGVFHSNRSTVTAAELIDRVGGTVALYEPMVHRLRGARVVERRSLRDAGGWEFPAGDMLLVVGQRGVRDLRIEAAGASSTHSHAVCLGLAPFPIVIPLTEGQATLNDLTDMLGQPRELGTNSVVLPVRVYPGEQPLAFDPGTLVMFPQQEVSHLSLNERLLTLPAPLESATSAISNEHAMVPNPVIVAPAANVPDLPAPSLLPSHQPTVEAAPSPLFIPAPSVPTASTVPPMEILRDREELHPPQAQVRHSAHTQAVPPASSTPTTEAQAPSTQESQPVLTTTDLAVANSLGGADDKGHSLAEVAAYTGCLAVICLALAGIWSYWDRLPSAATSTAFAEQAQSRNGVDTITPREGVDHVQALIDNRLPIIEENVELSPARQFQGVATAQRRLRLDSAQPLAGPHAAFSTYSPKNRPSSREAVVAAQESDETDSRLMRRVMAHLAVKRDRARQESDSNDHGVDTETDREQTRRERTEGSALENALRQVMRKERS